MSQTKVLEISNFYKTLYSRYSRLRALELDFAKCAIKFL